MLKAWHIWLLYPLTKKMVNHTPIIFKSKDGTQIRVQFIDVAHIHKSLKDIKKQILAIEAAYEQTENMVIS